MIFAVLGDIQGSVQALDAAVDEIDAAGIDTILHTGNCAVGQAGVNDVIKRMKTRGIVAVQGEMDRHLARMRPNSTLKTTRLGLEEQEAIVRAREFIEPENLEFLRALPRKRRLNLEGLEVLLCFGSPSSPFMPLTSHTPLVRFKREWEEAQAQIIICGSSNVSYYKWLNQSLFVGIAPMFEEHFGGDAHYVLIDTESSPWSLRLKKVTVESFL